MGKTWVRRSALVSVLAAAGGALALGPASRAAARPLVVLVSIDGLRPDYVVEADRYGVAIPNLRRMLAAGSHATGLVGVLPTVTYPSHATLVTGVAPARHGIVANKPFDPAGRNLDGWFWYAEDIRVPTLWDAAERAGLTTSNVAWPVTVGAHITYNIPQVWRASTGDDAKLSRVVSTPGLLAEAEHAIGPYPSGDASSLADDRKRADFCAYLIDAHHPDLNLCYLTALDEDQHRYGPGSPEVMATLEQLDLLVGQLRATAERAAPGRAIVAVVSDHGFARVERELQLNTALREAGLVTADAAGHVSSWRAFAWSSGGTAPVYLRDPADVDARARTAALLQRLAADPVNGIERLLDAEATRADGGFPGAAFVVAARPDCHLGTRLDGPVSTIASGGGAHGMLPHHREMDAALFLAGPGIPAGRDLGRVDMRDVAPTLAELLFLTLPAAEGHDLLAPSRLARQ